MTTPLLEHGCTAEGVTLGLASSAATVDGVVAMTVAPVLIAVALPAVIAGMVGGKYCVEVSESPRARLAAGAAP